MLPPLLHHSKIDAQRFEAVDASGGRTNRIAQEFLPVPVLQQSPPPPIRFGFASTTSADILRLAVVNTALSSQAGVCQVQAGFLDAASKDLVAWLRPVVRFTPPDPCLGIVATAESVDAASDLTRFVFPPNSF